MTKIIDELIAEIKPIKSNFDYCADNNIINGSLLVDIREAMWKLRKETIRECANYVSTYDENAANVVLEMLANK